MMRSFFDSAFPVRTPHQRFAARRTLAIALLALLASFPAATRAFGQTDYLVSQAAAGKRGGRLVISQRAEPRTFLPLSAIDAATKELLGLLHADLIHIDRATQRTGPALAKEWKVSPDGMRYTLTLRDGLRFSDGEPLTIDDVVFTFQVLLDEAVKAPARDLLQIGGKYPTVRKLDRRRMELTLPAPYAPAERLFDGLAILPRHKLEAAYKQGKLLDSWTISSAPGELVGAGPFRLKEYVPGQRAVLARNPHYWKKDKAGNTLPYLDEIVVLFVADQDAEALRFRAGETHLLSRVSAKSFAALSSGPGSASRIMRDLGPGLEFHFLFFNLNALDAGKHPALAAKANWLQSVQFRNAISKAVDRRSLVRLVFQGKATPILHHVSPGNKLYHVPIGKPDTLEVETARKELTALGLVRKGDTLVDSAGKPVEFSIAVNAANGEHKQMATILQEDLRELGIRVTVVPLEFRSLIDRVMNTADYEAAILALRDGDVDPTPQMPMLLSSGRMHFWRPNQAKPATEWEAEIDRLMNQQQSELDLARRKSIYARVQRIVTEKLPFVSLVSAHVLVGAHRDLANLQPGILAPHLLGNPDQIFWLRGDGRP